MLDRVLLPLCVEQIVGTSLPCQRVLVLIENRINQLEALNEVSAELDGDAVKEAALDAQFDDLAGESELDDELAALKAKMNQPSLPSAKGKDQDKDDEKG